MKKITIVLMLSCSFFLTSCVILSDFSVDESRLHFEIYQDKIEAVLSEKGIDLGEPIIDSEQEGLYFWVFTVVGENDSELTIRLENVTGGERFYLFFHNPYQTEEEYGSQLDPTLIADLLECFSGWKWTEEEIKDFIEAPESDYPPERWSRQRNDGDIIFKFWASGFWEEWTMSYVLNNRGGTTYWERIGFSGLTNNN